MKKLVSLFLASILSLSLLTSAFAAPVEPPKDPDPTPVVTLQPLDPDKPGEPPMEPQDKLPKPAETPWDED